MFENFKSAVILTDAINTSDHIAISLAVKAEANWPSGKNNCYQLQWEKVDPILYRKVLHDLLSQINIPVEALSCIVDGCQAHSSDLEAYYQLSSASI